MHHIVSLQIITNSYKQKNILLYASLQEALLLIWKHQRESYLKLI